MHDSPIHEVSREIPSDILQQYGDAALFIAYGCVLLECEAGKGYIYRALNVKTGRSTVIPQNQPPDPFRCGSNGRENPAVTYGW